jgi:hypothetical protein
LSFEQNGPGLRPDRAHNNGKKQGGQARIAAHSFAAGGNWPGRVQKLRPAQIARGLKTQLI